MSCQKLLLLILIPVMLTSCGARKRIAEAPLNFSEEFSPEESPSEYMELPEETVETEAPELSIIDHALSYLGTTYRYGGTSNAGMDCSGLVYTAFSQKDIQLPRSSREMATQGETLKLDEVEIGDLLFFITDKRKKTINHVGLVVELAGDVIQFIHSTTSAGVIISSLQERYWQEHFVLARRIL